MKHFDVIIIGGGPAGLNCAYHLSNSKLKVLLLEKNKKIGPKVCAGGLTKKTFNYLKLPEEIINQEFNEVTINSKNYKTVIKLKEPIVYTIDRENLGMYLLSKIINKKNIHIKPNSNVINIIDKSIILNNNETYSYDYLIGADGSNSIVRKYCKIPTKNLAIGIQYIIKNNKLKSFELNLNSKFFHSWYAWIFPHKDFVSIGTGTNPKFQSIKNTKNNFHQWLKEKNIDIKNAKFEAHPINYDFQGYRFNNIFLVGDAAGLASGFTGEGIHQALISSEEIAKIIMNSNYKPKKLNEIINKQKIHNSLLRIVIKLGRFRDKGYNLLTILIRNKIIAKKIIKLLT